jgi:two-component system, NarL family, response regulator DevR
MYKVHALTDNLHTILYIAYMQTKSLISTREPSMKPIRRVYHSAEEHSVSVNAKNNENKSDEIKLKVFIADDSSEIRNRLKEILKENKSILLVGESGDGKHVIMTLHDLKPDVFILDIHMPGGGIQVLKDIKSMRSESIVIILTAFPYPQYRQAYFAAGADYFFDKTNDIQKMTDILAELAEKRITNGINKK